MARVDENGFLRGRLGDLVYFVRGGNQYVKPYYDVPSRHKNVRSMENAAEFSRASKYSWSLVRAIKVVQWWTDFKIVAKMSKLIFDNLKLDTISDRGQRQIQRPLLVDYLLWFDFQVNVTCSDMVKVPFGANFDVLSGGKLVHDIVVPQFNVSTDFVVPSGATHFKLVGILAWEHGLGFKSNVQETSFRSTMSGVSQRVQFNWDAGLVDGSPVSFLMLQVKYFQLMNGEYYPYKNGRNNPLTIIGVK